MQKLPLDFTPDAHLLADRTILITGAGAGIGRALARGMALVGAEVVLVGRTMPKLTSIYDEIVAAGGREPVIHGMDFLGASPADYEALAAALDAHGGCLDGLVLNAGILGDMATLEHYRATTFAEVMHVNVTSCFLLVKMLLPLLRRSRDARVLFTSSGVGRRGRAHWGAYSVSKFATEGLAQILADETERDANLTVCTINPGATRTAMRAAAYPAEDPARLLAPEDIVPAYLYCFAAPPGRLHGLSCDVQ